MFLYKGLHFRNLSDMLGYALLDNSYIIHSEEYNQCTDIDLYCCSNEDSLRVLNEVRQDFISYMTQDELPDVYW